MKVQKTRKYYRKENHNKKLFQERKETFLNICKSSKKIEHISEPIHTSNSTRKSEILPTIITPNINNIGSVVNHVDTQMIDILKDPQKLKEFKEFQEFLKLKESAKINTPPTSEQLPPIDEEKDSYNETTNNYDIDEEIEEVLEDEDY